MKYRKSPNSLSTHSVQRIYDLIGKRYDWFGMYDAEAKERALALLDLKPGLSVIEAGLGTGKEHTQIEKAIAGRQAVGIDISWKMLQTAHTRCQSLLCQANVLRLPFQINSFDRAFATYLFDILSHEDILQALNEFYRVLKPGGRLVTASLTEGVDVPSRLLVSAWKAAYSISPITCAGCRPLQISNLFQQAGFADIHSEVIVQMAVPSEVITALKD